MPVRQPLHLIPPRRKTGREGRKCLRSGRAAAVRPEVEAVRRERLRSETCRFVRMASFGFAVGVPCFPGQAIPGGCRHECSRHGWSGSCGYRSGVGACRRICSEWGSYARTGGRSGTGSFGTGACGAGKRPCGMRSGLALCGGGEKAGRRSAASSVDGEPFLRDKRTVRPAVVGRSRRGTFVLRPVSRFASLGRMPVQGGRKRPKGDPLLQVALRFMCPAVARRRFPDRENLPALSSARSVRDRRGIN